MSNVTIPDHDQSIEVAALPDMFADLPAMDPFEIKQDMIAANLSALISYCGKTRSAIAEELGFHKSAVTRLLSGKNNTKIRTIWEIASHLGYDFDIVFHNEINRVTSNLQPWHSAALAVSTTSVTTPILIDKETPEEVMLSIQAGYSKPYYYSFPDLENIEVERWDAGGTTIGEYPALGAPNPATPLSYLLPNTVNVDHLINIATEVIILNQNRDHNER